MASSNAKRKDNEEKVKRRNSFLQKFSMPGRTSGLAFDSTVRQESEVSNNIRLDKLKHVYSKCYYPDTGFSFAYTVFAVHYCRCFMLDFQPKIWSLIPKETQFLFGLELLASLGYTACGA